MMNDQMKQELFAQMHTLLDAGLDMSRMFEILLDEYTLKNARRAIDNMLK